MGKSKYQRSSIHALLDAENKARLAVTAEQQIHQVPQGAAVGADEALLYSAALISGQDQDLLTSNVQTSSGAAQPL
jgi:hypothetical protein